MKAQIKVHNGVPTLFLNGQPTFASHQWLSSHPGPEGFPSAEAVRLFGEAGVHLYAVGVNVNGDPGSFGVWCGPREGRPDPYDFSMVEPMMRDLLKEDPQALFHLRLYFETAPWWNAMHPEECELASDGRRLNQSFASEVWRQDVNAFLRAYIHHLGTIGMADRVIAYQVQAGICGEWIKADSSMKHLCCDYSEPMRRHFRSWLAAKYRTDAALQAAWANPEVTLATAEVPSAEQQLGTRLHPVRDPAQAQHLVDLFGPDYQQPQLQLRDPSLEQQVVDYYTCLAELVTDDLIGFCRTVKELTHGQALAGAFFGYLMDLAWNDCFFGAPTEGGFSTIQRCGHLGLARVLRSPDVDYVVSPYGYAFRGLGGDGLPMPPSESVRLHGKLYILEEDSHLHNELDPTGRNFDRRHAIAINQREFNVAITHGLGIWWLADYPPGSYSRQDPNFHPWLKKFQQLGTWAMQLDRSPSAEVAVLVDDESFLYESVRNTLDLPLIFRQRVTSLSRFGAPHDVYLLNDLLEGRLPEYKLYIFLNPFHLDDKRREKLKQQIRRDGKTALWLYAPGYLNDTPGLEHMTDLTGIHFDKWDSPWGQIMHVTNFAHPITSDIPQDLFWGTSALIGPLFHVEDPDATVLGQVVYTLGRCKPGFVLKELDGWNSIYLASPDVPAPVLRGIAKYAGVHLYSDAGDVLHATRDLLGVHTVSGGAREFRLPRRVEVVYDLYNDRLLTRDADCFRVTLSPASSALYFTGRGELIEALERASIDT